MKRQMLLLAALLLASIVPSFGAMVQFSTVNSQLCFGMIGCGVQSQEIGGSNASDLGITISYMPTTSGTLNASPIASPNFGMLYVQCNDGTLVCPAQNLTGLQLYLVFTQNLPEAGSGQIATMAITGTIGGNSGAATVTWSVPSVVITTANASITYTVANSTLNLVNPSATASSGASSGLGEPGITTIQGRVEDTTVPEPSNAPPMRA